MQQISDSLVEKIISYEQGDMKQEDVINLFQDLITSGLVWKFQGSYGRIATQLIDLGLCEPRVIAA